MIPPPAAASPLIKASDIANKNFPGKSCYFLEKNRKNSFALKSKELTKHYRDLKVYKTWTIFDFGGIYEFL